MQLFVVVIYLCIGVGVYLIVDAIVGLIRVARGADDAAVERRLATRPALFSEGAVHYDILRPLQGTQAWQEYVPFYPRFLRLLQTSGTGLTPQRAIGFMAIIAFFVFIALALILPLRFFPLAVLTAPVVGVAGVILYVMKARSNRIQKFEEQFNGNRCSSKHGPAAHLSRVEFSRICKLHSLLRTPESAEAPLCAAYFCGLTWSPLQATQLKFSFTILAERFTMHSSSTSTHGQCAAQSPTLTSDELRRRVW